MISDLQTIILLTALIDNASLHDVVETLQHISETKATYAENYPDEQRWIKDSKTLLSIVGKLEN